MSQRYLGKGKWVTVEDSSESDRRNEVNTTDYLGNTESSSDSDAKKDLMDSEVNVLKGDIELDPLAKVSARTTITLSGLGKSISGLYFVDSVKYTFNQDSGFSKSCSVSRNGFGNYIKKGNIILENQVNSNENYRLEEVPREQIPLDVEQRTYTVVSGDTLWSIALKFYNDGSQYTKIADANNISQQEYSSVQIGRRLIIP